jgi:hypothetical protein
MNIFFLDKNPRIAASYHADIHLNKMILESAQMFTFAAEALGKHEIWMYAINKAHVKHPSTKWLYEPEDYKNNWAWLITMCNELDYIRNSIAGVHSSFSMINEIYWHMFNESWDKHKIDNDYAELTMRNHLAMPDIYKNHNDAVASYRAFYPSKIIKMKLEYKHRNVPEFMKKVIIQS